MRRVLLALFCVMVLSVGARGQEDFVNETSPVSMPFTGRSLAAYMKTAGFSPEQMAAARTLHEGYRAGYAAATAKAKKRWSELEERVKKDNDWPGYSEERAKAAEEFVDKARGLEAGLLSDLKSLATPEQAARVASAERARRRETGLRFALGLGERVDLLALLAEEKIAPDSPGMADLVSRWELNVDRLLIEKDRLLMDAMKGMMGQERNAGFEEKASKLLADIAGMAARVGEANRRAAAEAVLLAPEDKRAAMERAIKVMTFPRIYGPSAVEKAMGEALKWKDLGEEQRAKVAEMQGAYARAAEPINARWASGADQKSREFAKNPMQMMQQNLTNEGDSNDPYVSARHDRLALDKQYQEKLEALLNDAQKERLPKAEEHPGGIPEFLPDFEADVRADWQQWKDEGNDGG